MDISIVTGLYLMLVVHHALTIWLEGIVRDFRQNTFPVRREFDKLFNSWSQEIVFDWGFPKIFDLPSRFWGGGFKQWTVRQLSIMIIYNSTWSILIQWTRDILLGDKLT